MNSEYLSKCRAIAMMAREGDLADAVFQAGIIRNRSYEFFRTSEERGLYYWVAGEIALRSSKIDDAVDSLRSSLEILLATKASREAYGDIIAEVYLSLARATMRIKSYGEAAEAYSAAIKYASSIDGGDSWDRVLALFPSRAGAMFLSGDGQAQVILDEGLRRTRAVFGTDSPQTKEYINKTCAVLGSIGREKDIVKYEKIIQKDSIDEATLVLQELEFFVGIKEVKEHFQNIYQMNNLSRLRQQEGLPPIPVVMHMALLGPSGTGKTTVAYLAARLYQALGLLPTSRVVLATGGEMVSSYKASASKKVNDLCDQARGGVLLVNEAYALKDEDRNQVVATLLDRMEEERGNFALIVTGYKDAMEKLLENNEGLRSRFAAILEFNAYSKDQLYQIFNDMAKEYGMEISPEARERVLEIAEKEKIGGARVIRQLFQDSLALQAARISKISNPQKEDITLLLGEDIAG